MMMPVINVQGATIMTVKKIEEGVVLRTNGELLKVEAWRATGYDKAFGGWKDGFDKPILIASDCKKLLNDNYFINCKVTGKGSKN